MSPTNYVRTEYGNVIAKDFLRFGVADDDVAEHQIEIHVLSEERFDPNNATTQYWSEITEPDEVREFLGSVVSTLAEALNPHGDNGLISATMTDLYGHHFRIWQP